MMLLEKLTERQSTSGRLFMVLILGFGRGGGPLDGLRC
jgi:hypothetical protein